MQRNILKSQRTARENLDWNLVSLPALNLRYGWPGNFIASHLAGWGAAREKREWLIHKKKISLFFCFEMLFGILKEPGWIHLWRIFMNRDWIWKNKISSWACQSRSISMNLFDFSSLNLFRPGVKITMHMVFCTFKMITEKTVFSQIHIFESWPFSLLEV